MLASAPAAAQPAEDARDEEARLLFEAGRRALAAGRFEDALDAFQRSYDLSVEPALLFNIGVAADRLRQDDLAVRSFRAYLDAVPDAENGADVRRRIEVLEARLAEAPEPSDVDDATPSALPVEPSDSGGGVVFTWIPVGLGAAFAATTVALWVSANGDFEDLQTECAARVCTDDDVSGVDTLTTLTNVFLIASIASAITAGVVLTAELTGGSDEEVQVSLGPGSISVRGGF